MRTVILIILIAAFCGGGGAFLWLYYGGFGGERSSAVSFIEAYGDYAEIAERVEMLVHLPGTAGNSDRKELLAILDAILTQSMEAERRESLARLAYSNLDTIKKEIDAAQVAQAELYQVLQTLDNASRSFRSIELRNRVEEIVMLARKRAELSSRITSILSETNDTTSAIITRILGDGGELTQEHIRDINESTRSAEERFDMVTGLYDELISRKKELDKVFADFVAVAI